MPTGGVTTTHKNPPPRRPRKSTQWTHNRIAAASVAGAVLAVFLIGWAGYSIYAATHPAKSVTTDRTFSGKVTIVNNDGSAGCIQPDTGGNTECSVFYLEHGKSLQVGDEVNAAHQWVHTRAGAYDLLLIYSNKPGG